MNAPSLAHKVSPLTRHGVAVAVGGVAGTVVRMLIELVTSPLSGWPWGVFIANVIGCWGLGALRFSDDETVRLGWGTGFCGGLTTFSSLVLVVAWPRHDLVGGPVLWLLASVVSGMGALVVGRNVARRYRSSQRRGTGSGLVVGFAALCLTGVAMLPMAGAVLRWRSGVSVNRPGGFPWGTLLANTAASVLLGFVAPLQGAWLLAIGVGFCGALSTFSTLIAEVVQLIERRRVSLAGVYLVVSLALGIGGAWTGVRLGR